jgi:hypothetical protein
MILFSNVLMDRIVRKARKRKRAAGKKHFNLVGRRESLDAIEDVSGLVPG